MPLIRQRPKVFIPFAYYVLLCLCRVLSPSVSLNAQTSSSQNTRSADPTQPLGKVGLSETDVSNILEAITSKLRENGIAAMNLEPDALKGELVGSYVDMGAGTQSSLAVQGSGDLCSPTGNCLLWFFEKQGGRWQLLQLTGATPEDEGEADGFSFVPPRHNGLYDLILTRHMSAFESPMTVWRFDGTNYQFLKNYTDCSGQIVEGGCSHPAGSKTISATVANGQQGHHSTGIAPGPARITCSTATTDVPKGTTACDISFRPEFGAEVDKQLLKGKSVDVTGPGHVALSCRGQGDSLTCSVRIDQNATLPKPTSAP